MLKVPAIDIAEVGAGGGSLAWIDAGGLLRIGPQSAGAEPGPACYGRGNGQPTVTDANVVLGYLNPTTLAGGSLNIQPELSAQAIARNIANPLGLSTVAAASGIRHIANLEMARAIRTVSVERGHDTRLMSLIACGGGGPVHAVDVAAMLDIPRVVITPMSGVFCSLGMLGAPTGRAFVRSLARPLQGMTATQLEPTKQALLETAQAAMQSEGLTLSDLRMQWSVDARFFGQSSELSIPIEPGAGSEQIGQRFAAAYQKQYDTVSDEPIELVNLRLSVFGDEQELLDFGAMGANERQLQRIDTSAHRAVWFDTPRLQADAPGSPSQTAQNGFIDVPVFERPSLPTGKQIAGPAIIEAYDTTIVIPPGYDAAVASSGSVTIDRIRQADPS